MESISITGSKRKSLGKADAKVARRAGLVPCIVYGGKEETHIQIDERLFKNLVYTPNQYIVNLDIDGTAISAILKAIQFHPVTDRIVHVDFQELAGRPIKITLPILTHGQSKGVLAGGRLRIVRRNVKVQGLPKDMPSIIELDIADLAIGKSIKIADLDIPGVTFLADENQIIVAVRMKRGAMVEGEEAAEEGAEAAVEGGEAPAE
ncbi:MAG: large subunit ribosomal protein L25 [Bacteroidia bacterium]|jgi:large subunit ribosomal protein L25